MNCNGTEYFYVKNAQGDVTGLVSASGTRVVTYTYDAWGNPLTTTGSLATTLGAANPLRYRGLCLRHRNRAVLSAEQVL